MFSFPFVTPSPVASVFRDFNYLNHYLTSSRPLQPSNIVGFFIKIKKKGPPVKPIPPQDKIAYFLKNDSVGLAEGIFRIAERGISIPAISPLVPPTVPHDESGARVPYQSSGMALHLSAVFPSSFSVRIQPPLVCGGVVPGFIYFHSDQDRPRGGQPLPLVIQFEAQVEVAGDFKLGGYGIEGLGLPRE
jgi:hypothetical protein